MRALTSSYLLLDLRQFDFIGDRLVRLRHLRDGRVQLLAAGLVEVLHLGLALDQFDLDLRAPLLRLLHFQAHGPQGFFERGPRLAHRDLLRRQPFHAGFRLGNLSGHRVAR